MSKELFAGLCLVDRRFAQLVSLLTVSIGLCSLGENMQALRLAINAIASVGRDNYSGLWLLCREESEMVSRRSDG